MFYKSLSYCNISCADKRLNLLLEGAGRGPSAGLGISEKDIGDIFIGEEYEEWLKIENEG